MKRSLLALFAIMTVLVFAAVEVADARVGGRGSVGSRGMRTFTPPAATQTAPNQASPMQRSMTQPGQSTTGMGSPAMQPTGGLLNRPGLLGGLAAGFLGAGLFGMLFGGGLFSGLGSFASILGLLLQVGLVILIARLAWSWWQRRNAPAYAGMPRQIANEPGYRRNDFTGSGAGAAGAAAAAGSMGAMSVDKEDYDDFERLLTEIQDAYSNEDLAALRSRATPEMVSYFAEDLAANASRGVVNKISGVKLLQGDLAEAWREGATEYATVAMRFELVDRMVDRSGRVVEGGDEPMQATELWTFMRSRGGSWILSAIQQA